MRLCSHVYQISFMFGYLWCYNKCNFKIFAAICFQTNLVADVWIRYSYEALRAEPFCRLWCNYPDLEIPKKCNSTLCRNPPGCPPCWAACCFAESPLAPPRCPPSYSDYSSSCVLPSPSVSPTHCYYHLDRQQDRMQVNNIIKCSRYSPFQFMKFLTILRFFFPWNDIKKQQFVSRAARMIFG